MNRLLVAAGLLFWAGTSLVLSAWPRLARPSLRDRLAPFHPGSFGPEPPPALLGGSATDLLAGPARALGDRLAGLAGVQEPVGRRLRRVHSHLDVTSFRLRQLGWMAAAGLAGLLAAAAGAPAPLAVLLVVGTPILTFLIVEQRLAKASERWQEALGRELPVVAEQLATLLNAGFSLSSATNRVAERGSGRCASDLRVVANRIHQGLDEVQALQEWAELAAVDTVSRLVRVLSLHAEAPDLGRLVSAEARQARRDLARKTLEQMERRGEQVWIPVSVAALVPGAILLAVPVLAALRLFTTA